MPLKASIEKNAKENPAYFKRNCLGELVAIVNLIGLDSPCGVDEATLGCVWEGFPERID